MRVDPVARTVAEVRLVEPEAFLIRPDDRLVIRIPDLPDDDPDDAYSVAQGIHLELDRIGLGDRSVILVGDVEITVAREAV